MRNTTAVGFNKASPRGDKPPTPNAGFNSTKGFGDAAFGDPSIKKLKEDIAAKERVNTELEDEITRLRYSLKNYVGDNEIVATLHKELEIKQDQIRDRDDEIKDLIDNKNQIEEEKIALSKEFEKHKITALLGKKFHTALIANKSTVNES